MVKFKPVIITTFSLVTCIFSLAGFTQTGAVFQTSNGKISFRSDAPLELIRASSTDLVGIIDNEKRTFGFVINIRSFDGFNTALQKQHFHENYMESDKYPTARFNGKIIEDQDLTADGVYEVRAKGNFTIHGVTHERIIKSKLTVSNHKILVTSNFTLLLSDYDIPIPRVVYQKLANEIKVEVTATLLPR